MEDFDWLVVMADRWECTKKTSIPWLASEKRFIGDAVSAGRPSWNMLGAQLLAVGWAVPCA